ncbi:START domain-containing protein [Pseudidiomarina sp. CB1]|uniref:START domain-containing protein n=1 Tax=Pseudidiomarina sp. CB1 TaxID=2972484 RepID=UPI0021639DB9|nr:START domain-containing protein [Pseudidiomarina sp. CB1]
MNIAVAKTYALSFCLGLFFVASAHAQQHDTWQPAVANQHYTIDYRERADKVLELRAELVVTAQLGSFLHLLEDVENISSWLARAEKATVLAQPDAHTHVVHTVFSGFFLVARRDMVTRSVWHQDPATKAVTITVENANNDYDIPTDGVRITNLAAEWQLFPLANGQLRITYQGYADPAGALLGLVARSAALEALKKTLARLPAALENHQRPYEGIVEP